MSMNRKNCRSVTNQRNGKTSHLTENKQCENIDESKKRTREFPDGYDSPKVGLTLTAALLSATRQSVSFRWAPLVVGQESGKSLEKVVVKQNDT